ncbi:DUF2069 domain-containing protein [Paraburkholderia sp. UYCP14C]|uniref:DUF2069 domain-containing protein n=1 Tax=Paraburkholderia sp. UYCP14C TaxID=2511130 RepID=UPI00102077DB|nr:DUF2069 domain-containing protein [Paraburkholderia sp. UYCP14C]RZF24591.1 DUF2069 domain-containing protein [Paraburkholderia sp. UYCP14C]
MNQPHPQPTERDTALRDARGAESASTNSDAHPKAATESFAANASASASLAPVQPKGAAARLATFTLVAMIVLAVAWEWWLAPLRPGGSLLVLKALPLLSALPGVWRRRLYTLQWASMLILLYFAEGIVRGWSDHGLSARLGWLQAALAAIFFACALAYVGPFKRAAKRIAKRAANQAASEAARQAAGEPPPPA